MSIFEFSVAQVPDALSALGGFIRENMILCAALLISYVLVYAYQYINNKSVDSEIYEIDLLTAGISTILIALLLLGLDESTKSLGISQIDFGSPTARVAIFLFVYAALLIFFAFSKKLPKFMVILLGNSEVDLFINFVAILMTDSKLEITGTLLFVIAAPLSLLLIIQRIRRAMR